MATFVITAKTQCPDCPHKALISKEGKALKYPWQCIHEKRVAKPAIETTPNAEKLEFVEGKKIRNCELVYVAPVKEKKVRVKKEKVVKEAAPVAPSAEAAPAPAAAPETK